MQIIIEWINSWTLNGKISILVFLPFAALLFIASLKLVKYAEVIILKTRFGGSFVGGAIIAAVTSFPELITEVTQSSAGIPGAGIADDIGSNAFSAFLIAISLLILFKTKFFEKLDKFSRILIFISSLLAFVMFMFLLINKDVDLGPIGIIPMGLFAFYIVMLIMQYKFDSSAESVSIDPNLQKIPVKKALFFFGIYALAITGLSLIVNWTASSMILGAGLDERGTGGVLLAITTSLPEIIAYFSFLKKKQPITALAALMGSHFFNIGISFFGDLAYSTGPTFKEPDVGANWPVALFTGIMMLIIFMQFALAKKIKNKYFHIFMPSLAIVTYVVGWTLTLVLQV